MLRVQTIEHAREGDGFPQVFQTADPGYGPFDTHAEAGVRDAAVFAQVKIPLESFLGEVVLVDALEEQVVGGHALRASDDFSVAFRREDVDAEREFGTL